MGLEGALLVAVFLYVGIAVTPDSVPGSARFLPYAVFAAGLLASWRFGRSRLALGMVALALADLLMVGAFRSIVSSQGNSKNGVLLAGRR